MSELIEIEKLFWTETTQKVNYEVNKDLIILSMKAMSKKNKIVFYL